MFIYPNKFDKKNVKTYIKKMFFYYLMIHLVLV